MDGRTPGLFFAAAVILAALLHAPLASSSEQTMPTSYSDLSGGPDVALGATLGTGDWGIRLGLLVSWAMTGLLLGMTDTSTFPPYPVVALAGWLGFEWASASRPPGSDPDGWTGNVLKANFLAISIFMMINSARGPCSPLENGGQACFQRSQQEWSLSFRSGPGRLMTRLLDLVVDPIWKLRRGEAPRPWNILLTPVFHQGSITGFGAGVQFTL